MYSVQYGSCILTLCQSSCQYLLFKYVCVRSTLYGVPDQTCKRRDYSPSWRMHFLIEAKPGTWGTLSLKSPAANTGDTGIVLYHVRFPPCRYVSGGQPGGKGRSVEGDSKLSVSSVLYTIKKPQMRIPSRSSCHLNQSTALIRASGRNGDRPGEASARVIRPMPSSNKVWKMFQRTQESFVGSIAANLRSTYTSPPTRATARLTEFPATRAAFRTHPQKRHKLYTFSSLLAACRPRLWTYMHDIPGSTRLWVQ